MEWDVQRYKCVACGAKRLFRQEYQENIECRGCGHVFTEQEEAALEKLIERCKRIAAVKCEKHTDLLIRKLRAAHEAMSKVK
jgi:phage FluMu protein Com